MNIFLEVEISKLECWKKILKNALLNNYISLILSIYCSKNDNLKSLKHILLWRQCTNVQWYTENKNKHIYSLFYNTFNSYLN